MIIKFPKVETANEDGLVGVGGNLHINTLLYAYSLGIFPWPIDQTYLTWFSPPRRGVFFIKKLSIPRSLKKFMADHPFKVMFNKNFEKVITSCARSINRQKTWITPEIIKAYTDLFYAGYAYSVEAYDKENVLVGGLYGVCRNGCISGESMFYISSHASKICFIYLIKYLDHVGIEFLDTQVLSPVVKIFGGEEIDRDLFIKKIRSTKKKIFQWPI